MNLDELRSVQAKERRKDSLQHLRDAFYDDVAAYVSDLRAARDRRAEQVDNPFSDDDVRRMSDELETAEEVAEALYERRVGKVVKLASFAAAEMSVETEGMTTQERALFDDLVARIRANKSEVLATLAGDVPTAGDDGTPPDPEREGEPAGTPTPRDDDAGSPASEPDPPPETGTSDDPDTRETDEAVPPESEGSVPPEADPNSDVLAGAMGGDSNPSTADTASTDGGPTTVEPDPAPPGAPGVDDPVADGPETTHAPKPTTDGPETAASDRTADDPGPMGDGTAPSGGIEAPTTDGTDTPEIDRETVRITRDVGEIFGVDEREYDLASEDVVTLPAANAKPLVERDAAERIE
ncbi:DNA replication factor GINS [Halorubrum aquaticum]|uniref:DNA replication factor GINS n=1 Tax=Halorubrum aquaticum TaxID=387340 RepID=A0A1I3AFP6_9EURY|nr:hypothetical protein [Halorubrum aquaticum]SFH48815.1 DNA replication factor GINS [Halorubrum aquaticum]